MPTCPRITATTAGRKPVRAAKRPRKGIKAQMLIAIATMPKIMAVIARPFEGGLWIWT
jgi:hypothetical protein